MIYYFPCTRPELYFRLLEDWARAARVALIEANALKYLDYRLVVRAHLGQWSNLSTEGGKNWCPILVRPACSTVEKPCFAKQQ